MDHISSKFTELYGKSPKMFRSPGRVNLIGEHTDYNEGFVLPAAINKEMVFAIAPNGLDKCRVYAADLNESEEFLLADLKASDKGWCNYLIGVVAQFQKKDIQVAAFDLVFGGNIPIGAGVSSSAALECGLGFALNELNGTGLDKLELVKMAQKAEHEWAGVQCGIMDQFASMFGKDNSVIRLDCRSLEKAYFPLNIEGYKILLLDTGVKHSLASSAYNTRREECEAGVAFFAKSNPEIKSLRNVTVEMLDEAKGKMDATVYTRSRYVVEENNRVLAACEALEKGDLAKFGEQMYGSHNGLSKEYEVSCPELDFLVEQTKDKDFVLGSRMMGGGFGGCTINIIKEEAIDAFVSETAKIYHAETGIELKAYVADIVDGSSVL
ncbi:galactokinase [Flammeovirgaceae bacterium SG7u.111]|nr:galactokinase [Flammeovirgaceae bacterium SG7u.132]WPO35971.1 galactokinase [Flammeovirgaceae bacterium SG7u.111]